MPLDFGRAPRILGPGDDVGVTIGARATYLVLATCCAPVVARTDFRTLLDGAEGWGRLAAWEADEIRTRFETLITDARSTLG